MNLRLYLFTFLSLVFTFCCFANKNNTAQNGEKHIIRTTIVSKSFIKKNNKATGKKELYISVSEKDYFIKFCESDIKRKSLENYLNKKTKPITLEIEYRKGYWDICDGNFMKQSRKGAYVIIHRIIDTKSE